MADSAILGGLNSFFNSANNSFAGSVVNPQVSTYNPEILSPAGPMAVDQYSLDVMKYPTEIGAPGRTTVPSYVTFNIYVPISSPYVTNGQAAPATVQARSQDNIDYEQQTYGKPQAPGQLDYNGASTLGAIQAINYGGGGGLFGALGTGALAAGAGASISKFTNKVVTLKPQLRRIGTSIQLYMPDTVMSSMNHEYRTVNATTAIGNLQWATLVGHGVADAITSAVKALQHSGSFDSRVNGVFNSLAASANKNAATKELYGNALEQTGLVGAGFTDLALRSSGVAVNPQVELIYNGTQQRSFIFEFRFTPRSAQESQTIYRIIQTFKQFSSPGIQKGSLGRFFIVPAQFDIIFNFQNTQNPFIGKISTCVLESIDVNYVGQGQWASFPDGSPAEINLQLRFREAEIIYDFLVQQGY